MRTHWSEADLAVLKDGYAKGVGVKSLAASLGRSYPAVRNKAKKLGITMPSGLGSKCVDCGTEISRYGKRCDDCRRVFRAKDEAKRRAANPPKPKPPKPREKRKFDWSKDPSVKRAPRHPDPPPEVITDYAAPWAEARGCLWVLDRMGEPNWPTVCNAPRFAKAPVVRGGNRIPYCEAHLRRAYRKTGEPWAPQDKEGTDERNE